MKHPKHLWFTVILAFLLSFVACLKAQVTSSQPGQKNESLQPEPFKGEVYETADGRERITLTSPDEAEISENGGNFVYKYTKKDGKLRILVTSLGTTVAMYFQITTDGLQDNNGARYFLPTILPVAQECYKGMCYASGQGVAKDEGEAVKWFRKAADQNFAAAQYALGLCYANGQGVAKDEVQAVKWFRKAADQNLVQAQNNLGACYANGQGVVKDEAEAVNWYRKAAEQGNVDAQNDLAWILATSENSAIRNGPKAVDLALQAVRATDNKNPVCLDTLAAAYAEVGQFESAVSTVQEAIALLQTEAQKDDYRSRLKLYEAKSPYRVTELLPAPTASQQVASQETLTKT